MSLLVSVAIALAALDEPAPRLSLRIIVVESQARAVELQAALRSGADFADLARKESVDPAAEAGGDLGSVDPATLHSDLQTAIRGLAPGQVTDPVRLPSGRGYAILQVARATGNDAQTAAPTMTTAAALPLTGKVVAREPPNTSGLINVETAIREFPKPDGWDRDAASICAMRQEVLGTVTGRLRALTASDNPTMESWPAREQLHAYSLAGLFESYQGNLDRALDRFQQVHAVAKASLPVAAPFVEEMLGSTYFHKAEMESGLYARPDEHCLFPPRGRSAGISRADDVRRAIDYFTGYLEQKPEDLEVKWLLNLAYAALGRYPEGVPPAYLIPRDRFESKGAASRFTDVAWDAGLGQTLFVSPALVADDFDGDGLVDLMVSSYDICAHVHYFHNDGDGRFSDRSAAAGLVKIAGGQGLTAADFDNDGCLDLAVTRGAWQGPMPLSLLRNDCKGGFTEVTRAAGLAEGRYASQLGVWADFDNDGFVDLFVGNEQGPSQLFRNRGDGTFENVSRAAGIERTTFVKGAVAEDYDNDGWPDLFLSNQVGGDNLLYHNNRNGTFTEVAKDAGVNQSWRSFATWFFDYDNDGWPDLFVASDYASVEESMRTYLGLPRSTGPLKLYRNTRDGRFADVTTAVGLDKMFMPMGANFGDFDNDGYLDVYLGTGAPEWGSLVPNVLLRNSGGTTFVDVTAATGTGEIHKTHGIAFADLEGRGQKTLLAGMGGAALADAHALRVFRNPGNGNKWLALKLEGTKTNRAALGARIKVTVKDGKGVARSFFRTVTSGGSFGSSPLEQQIGLGQATGRAQVEITWPRSGTVQRFADVPLDQFLEVRELADDYVTRRHPQFVLGGPASRQPERTARTED